MQHWELWSVGEINHSTVAELVRLGILFVEDGNHGENRPLPHEFVARGIPFVRPPDLVDGEVDLDRCEKINATARARIRKGIGRGGDILFTHRATVGRLALMDIAAGEFVTNPGVTVWRSLKPEILDPLYLYYWMHTPAFMNQVWAVAGGSDTFPYVSLTEQRRLRVEWPSPKVQKRLADTLRPLDLKIAINRETNKSLETMAQAIFRDWFIDFGPTQRKRAGATDPVVIMGGVARDGARAASLAASFTDELGDNGLPVGWRERPIGELVNPVGGSTPSTGEPSYWAPGQHRWATPKDLSGMRDFALFETERRISDEGLAKISSGLLPVGTVLLSSRAPIGYLAIAQKPVAINQGFIALQPAGPIGSAYLYLWCKANMPAIVANANGSTFQEISKKNFKPIVSATPIEDAVFRAFSSMAQPLLDRVVSASRESHTLAETRDYLLPRLMSGELRLGRAAEVETP